MSTPYEVLGVPQEASPDEIKQAYRRLSMLHHPDRQGDPEVFKRIKAAYEVLSDPERRLQFDTSGTTTQAPSLRQMAERMVPGLAQEALAGAFIPEWVDMLELMTQKVQDQIRAAGVEQDKAVQGRAKWASLGKRFKRKGGGENMIAGMIASQVEAAEKFLENNTQRQLLLLEVLEVLKDYSYSSEGSTTITFRIGGIL